MEYLGFTASLWHPSLAALLQRGQQAIQNLIESPAISSAFVERLVKEYGGRAIGKAYLIRDFQPDPDLAYLLRRFKGKFFRNRYPNLAFKQGDDTPHSNQ